MTEPTRVVDRVHSTRLLYWLLGLVIAIALGLVVALALGYAANQKATSADGRARQAQQQARALYSQAASAGVSPVVTPAGVPPASKIVGPAGANGSNGSNGLNGSPGSAGATGPSGPPGPSGSPGVAGSVGANGAQGSPGPAGPQGEAGPTGQAGPQGPPGPQGAPGTVCPDGYTLTRLHLHHVDYLACASPAGPTPTPTP